MGNDIAQATCSARIHLMQAIIGYLRLNNLTNSLIVAYRFNNATDLQQ